MQLSEHFSLNEMLFSEIALRQGFDNTPPQSAIDNLGHLALTLLEPARLLLGVPLHINSGYRSRVINECIGGDAHSAHMEGRAADFVPVGVPLLDAFHDLRVMAALPYDRIIWECQAWIHIAFAPVGQEPKRAAELASGGPGNWHYTAVA